MRAWRPLKGVFGDLDVYIRNRHIYILYTNYEPFYCVYVYRRVARTLLKYDNA